MLALVWDTETSGKATFGQPSISPVQPNLVQLGAILVDLESRRNLQTLDVIVRPSGWTIPAEASAIHGVSHAEAERVGIDLGNAVFAFRDLASRADFLVCHNTQFDKLVMERASAMVDLSVGADVATPWQPTVRWICTMRESTPIVKIRTDRPLHNADWKWPRLQETHRHFFGHEFDGAHNAIADVVACRDVLFALVDRGHLTLPGVPAR